MKRIAILVLICGLAGAGVFAGYKIHGKVSYAANDSTAIFADLPTTAPVVAFVDAKAFRDSAIYKKLMENNPSPTPSGDYADFLKNTGFDFSRDLDRVAIAIESAEHGSKMTAIAEGRFNQERIAAYAKLKGKSSTRNGRTYFEFSEDKENRTVEMTFLSPDRVRISSVEIKPAKPAEKNADGSPAITPKPSASHAIISTPEEFRDRIARVSGIPMFVIADVGSWSGQVNLGNYTDLIRSIRRYTLTVTPDGDSVHLALEAECATAEDAQQLGSTLGAMKLLAPTFLNGAAKKSADPEAYTASVNDFMNSIKIGSDGVHAKLSFTITGDMITKATHMNGAKPAVQPIK